jgi:hypothetical protein
LQLSENEIFIFSKDLHVNTYFSFIVPTNFPLKITGGQITVKCIVGLSDFQGLGLEESHLPTVL